MVLQSRSRRFWKAEAEESQVSGSQWLGRIDRGGTFRIPGGGTEGKEGDPQWQERWGREAAVPERVQGREHSGHVGAGESGPMRVALQQQRWNIGFSKK